MTSPFSLTVARADESRRVRRSQVAGHRLRRVRGDQRVRLTVEARADRDERDAEDQRVEVGHAAVDVEAVRRVDVLGSPKSSPSEVQPSQSRRSSRTSTTVPSQPAGVCSPRMFGGMLMPNWVAAPRALVAVLRLSVGDIHQPKTVQHVLDLASLIVGGESKVRKEGAITFGPPPFEAPPSASSSWTRQPGESHGDERVDLHGRVAAVIAPAACGTDGTLPGTLAGSR
jgi:hypothetical protein